MEIVKTPHTLKHIEFTFYLKKGGGRTYIGGEEVGTMIWNRFLWISPEWQSLCVLLVTISTRLEAGNCPMGRKVIIYKVSLQHTAFSLNDVTQSQEEVSNTNTRIIKFLFVIHVQQLTALQKSKIIQYIITCIYNVVNRLFCQILHKLFTGEYTALKNCVADTKWIFL